MKIICAFSVFFVCNACIAFAGGSSVFASKINGAISDRPFLSSQVRPQPNKKVPPKPMPNQKSSPTAIRYSQSAQAANMIMPALWLGLPTLFIIALIIRSMRGD